MCITLTLNVKATSIFELSIKKKIIKKPHQNLSHYNYALCKFGLKLLNLYITIWLTEIRLSGTYMRIFYFAHVHYIIYY